MTDDLTRGFITRRLDADHQLLLHDARRIASSLNTYIADLERNAPGVTFSGTAVTISTYLIQHTQAAARLDAARDMARTLMEDER
ncbi:hypothetical protein ACWENA_08380 [Streptomyces sp. NPDC004779]